MKRALVLGSTGVIGWAIARHLVAQGGWDVVCATRSGTAEAGARGLLVDLLDETSCRSAAEAVGPVSHVFFAAYQPRPTRVEEIAPNLQMLGRAVELAQTHRGTLQRVVLVTGGKYYGLQWGPIRTPARESDARNLGPNFYYAQEDLLRERGAAAGWTWCNLIPPFVTGFSDRAPMNLVMALGVLASLAREMGQPLRFPGHAAAWDALHQIADADQIAAAAAWAAESPNAVNQVFNIANGDPSRWRNTWPAVARHFGVPVGDPLPLPLPQVAAGLGDVWRRIAEQYRLRNPELQTLVDWNWAGYMFGTAFANDVVFELGKIRRAGFQDCLDTEAVLLRRFSELQTLRLIP
jgi:nucleoside-diphosphate-sugar epimerase